MDKENIFSIKNNKKKYNKTKMKKRKNHQNETDEKFITTTKNEFDNKINNDNLNDLSNEYKNLDILLSNKLQSFINNHEGKQTSFNLIKKQNNLNNFNNLIKQKNKISKQSILKLFMNRDIPEKSSEIFNQSNSLLLNKDTNNSKGQNSIVHLNKNKKKDTSHNKYNMKITNSSKNIRKKIKVKLYSNSESSPCLSKNCSSKFITQRRLFSHESLNKILNN